MTGNRPSIAESVAKVRARISALQRDAAQVSDARVPRDTAIARIDAYIAEFANWQHGRALVQSFTSQAESPAILVTGIDLPMQLQHLFAWVNGAALRKALVAGIDDIYRGLGDDQAMTRADLSNRKKLIDEELFDLQVEEERLVMQAEAQGLSIPRRVDADPRAILAA